MSPSAWVRRSGALSPVRWLTHHPRYHRHFTPTPASGLPGPPRRLPRREDRGLQTPSAAAMAKFGHSSGRGGGVSRTPTTPATFVVQEIAGRRKLPAVFHARRGVQRSVTRRVTALPR